MGITVLPVRRVWRLIRRSSNLETVFVQSRIDTTIASSATSLCPASDTSHNQAPKRRKVYCDKWLHEGVYASTQQGCKYKHEMLLDKDTQELLGLYHSLPIW